MARDCLVVNRHSDEDVDIRIGRGARRFTFDSGWRPRQRTGAPRRQGRGRNARGGGSSAGGAAPDGNDVGEEWGKIPVRAHARGRGARGLAPPVRAAFNAGGRRRGMRRIPASFIVFLYRGGSNGSGEDCGHEQHRSSGGGGQHPGDLHACRRRILGDPGGKSSDNVDDLDKLDELEKELFLMELERQQKMKARGDKDGIDEGAAGFETIVEMAARTRG